MLRTLVLTMLATLLFAVPASAQERTFFATDEWRLEPADEFCLLLRNFRNAEGESIRLQMQNFGQAAGFKVMLVGDGLPLRDGSRGMANFKYRFKSDPSWREASGVTAYVQGADALTFYGDLRTAAQVELAASDQAQVSPEEWRARTAEVDALALAYPRRHDTVLQLGPVAEPLNRLSECASQLPRGWGYDPAVLQTYLAPRLLNGGEIATAVREVISRPGPRYSADAIHFRLHVDENGSVANCVVQQPRTRPDIQALICEVLSTKARFEPGQTAGGEPVAAPYVSRILFGFR